MAADEAILESIQAGNERPVLRLYAWQPPCLSLGYAQSILDVDQTRLFEHGWQLVRRPTGGRAILHTDELTYSVLCPPTEPRMAGGVLESYRRLAEALIQALHSLGIPAESHPTPLVTAGDPKAAVCFEVPSNYEITVHGKKLVGSAQARRKEAVLQHGTFPLSGDLTRITRALVFPDESARQAAAERLLHHATTAEAVLGEPLAWETAAQAFAQAFEQALNLTLLPAGLSEHEKKRTHELVREKYGNAAWTAKS